MIKNSLPRSQRCDRHRGRRIKVNMLRLTHELAGRRRNIFGITAGVGAEVTIDLIACYKIFGARRTRSADCLDRSGHFTTKDQRRLQPEQPAKSVAYFPIDGIDRCRPHFHQQLIFSRLRPFYLCEFNDLFISVPLDPHRFHGLAPLCFGSICLPQHDSSFAQRQTTIP